MRANGISRTIAALLLGAMTLGASPEPAPAGSPPDPNAMFDSAVPIGEP
jgi:hypothetical protein